MFYKAIELQASLQADFFCLNPQMHEQQAKRVANVLAGRSPCFTRSKRMKSERSELRMCLQDAVHVLQIGNPLYKPGIQTIKI